MLRTLFFGNRSTPQHGECLQRKKYILEQLENKLDTGVDRAVSAILGYVKVTLQSEQKKSDFKPEGDDALVNIATPVISSNNLNTFIC